ncbi:nck-associated protein 5-like [Scyliorhinus torazame]|uniref:nck-associated protein 5-like n=1 Tax=Scyliorhinus torazame TaxID=75743 RepID=UPI003B5A5053
MGERLLPVTTPTQQQDVIGEQETMEGRGDDRCPELLDKLRALEDENIALALANDSQREAYEHCLDEVATHVVQALLNQKTSRKL